jgi:hypothetical protein
MTAPYIARVRDPDAMVKVSPAFVVLAEVSGPHHSRLGVPAESHSSTPLIVVAGMLVTVTAALEAIEPADAEAKVTAGAPVPEVYPPPVASSVPLLVLVPFAVISRQLIGAVGAVKEPPTDAWSRPLEKVWSRLLTEVLP